MRGRQRRLLPPAYYTLAFLFLFLESVARAEEFHERKKEKLAELSRAYGLNFLPGFSAPPDGMNTMGPYRLLHKAASPIPRAPDVVWLLPPGKIRKPTSSDLLLDRSRFDGRVVEQFDRAWSAAGRGIREIECVILVYKRPEGGYRAQLLPSKNQFRKFSFTWIPTAVAIIHTHPNSVTPWPSDDDMGLADKLHVPIYTLTSKGMYEYDPATKSTRKICEGLDWLQLDKLNPMFSVENRQNTSPSQGELPGNTQARP